MYDLAALAFGSETFPNQPLHVCYLACPWPNIWLVVNCIVGVYFHFLCPHDLQISSTLDAEFSNDASEKDDYYKAVSSKIPWRASAPESLTHRRFSRESDMWMYGMYSIAVFLQYVSTLRQGFWGSTELLSSTVWNPSVVAYIDEIVEVVTFCQQVWRHCILVLK